MRLSSVERMGLVLSVLDEAGGCTCREIARRTGLGVNVVKGALMKLKNRGCVRGIPGRLGKRWVKIGSTDRLDKLVAEFRKRRGERG